MRLLKMTSVPPGLKLTMGWTFLFLMPLLLAAQTKTFTGTVKDESNNPVAGASVTIKNKSVGTVTNELGSFSINAVSGDVLVISSINLETTELKLGEKNNLAIVLKSKATELSDVVVVGYGTKTKRDIGGGVLTVDQKLLQDRPVTNTLSALQGTTPGLVITRTNGQPGNEGISARIRGITSLGVNNAPLVIIDGVEGDIDALNPNDIQTITVLEDAASAAIYGAKAGGGVIVVTTKSGRINQKTKFDITVMNTVRTPYARPELLSSRQQGEMINAARLFAGQNPDFTATQLQWFDDPSVEDYLNPGNNTWEYYYNNNMVDILMRDKSMQRNVNVTASGGGDKTTYQMSVGYLDQQGVFKFGPDSYKRLNARLNYNTKLSKIFSIDTRVSFAKEKILSPSQGITGQGLIYNIYSIRAARNPIFTPGTTDKYAFIGTISNAYPILKDGGYTEEDRYNVNGVITLSAKQILKGLDLKAVYSPGLVLTNRETFNKTVPRFTVDVNKNPVAGTALNPVNSLFKARPFTVTQNFFATADYDYKINRHSFHVLGGYEYKIFQYDWVQAVQRALMLNNFPTLNYTTLAAGDVTNSADNIQINTWLSYFGRLSYNYDNKYYAEGVIRRDGSSRLAPGFKFQNFYSGNVFWRVSQEDWFKNALPWVNEFKIAASYGTAGGAQTANQTANNYDFQAVLNRGFYPFNDARTAYLFQSALPAESKAWEIISTANLGFDLAILRNRLKLHFDYFEKKNNNVFVAQSLPALLGVTPNATNGAAIEVKGWGVTLNWSDKFRDGGYFISANLSDDVNKVVSYTGGAVSIGQGINASIPGYSTNSIFGFKSDGYFQNAAEVAAVPRRTTNTGVGDIRLLDMNKDGFINQGIGTIADHGDLVYLGNTNPRYIFGFNTGVNWKGFDISVLFNGVGKRSVYIDPIASIALYDGWRMPWAIHQDYWRPDNPNAKFPAIRLSDRVNNQVSSHWIQNATYIRLKNLQVGYTLSNRVHKVKGLGDVRLYFSGQDLWEKTGMWFNYYDPENTDRVGFSYPLWRSYALGLNISL